MRRIQLISILTLILLLVAVFVPLKITVVRGQTADETEALKPGIDPFLDLFGSINYTYHEDHSNYEGKTLSLSNQGESQRIKFAITLNGMLGAYWLNPDGSVPMSHSERKNAMSYALYDHYEELINDGKIEQSCIFGFCVSSVDISASSIESDPDSTKNQTVDNMQTDAPTNFNPSLYEFSGQNDSAILETTLIEDIQTTEDKYEEVTSDVLSMTIDDQKLLKVENDKEGMRQKFFYTANITETIYLFLAEYIEDVNGYEPRTVKIDHDTEDINATSMSVYVTKEMKNKAREIIDQKLIEEGMLTPQGSLGDLAGSMMTGIVDELSGGMASQAGIDREEYYQTLNEGFSQVDPDSTAGHYLPMWDAFTGSAENTDGAFDHFEQYSSEKVDNWVEDAGNLISAPFSFLGGIAKVLGFIFQFWWVFLIIGIVIIGLYIRSRIGPLNLKRKYSSS